MILVGIAFFAVVLLARGTKDENKGSLFFFRDIVQQGDIQKYTNSFMGMTEEDVLNTILSDIYANAEIAKKKYDYYNVGFFLSVGGFVVLCILLIIGMLVY